MKFLVFALALLVAGSSAFNVQGRQSEGELFVENLRMAIEAIQRYIVRNNLDPLILERGDRTIARFPYINLQLFIEGVNFTGLSDIVIHSLNYSNVFSRLRYDFELPGLDFIIGDSGVSGTILSGSVSAKLAGRLTITNIRFAGEAYFQPDLLTGAVAVTDFTATFSLNELKSDITIELMENDYSEWLNNLINVRITTFLAENERDINRILGIVLRTVAQLYLDNRPRIA